MCCAEHPDGGLGSGRMLRAEDNMCRIGVMVGGPFNMDRGSNGESAFSGPLMKHVMDLCRQTCGTGSRQTCSASDPHSIIISQSDTCAWCEGSLVSCIAEYSAPSLTSSCSLTACCVGTDLLESCAPEPSAIKPDTAQEPRLLRSFVVLDICELALGDRGLAWRRLGGVASWRCVGLCPVELAQPPPP